MALKKHINLLVKEYSINLTNPLKFYKNDCIDLHFTISEYGLEIKNNSSKLKIMPINPLKAKLLIETPLGIDSINEASIIENEVVFKITEGQTKFVGKSKMQILLYDEDGYQSALPWFEYEVKNTINEELDGENILAPDIILADDGSVILVDEDTAILEY